MYFVRLVYWVYSLVMGFFQGRHATMPFLCFIFGFGWPRERLMACIYIFWTRLLYWEVKNWPDASEWTENNHGEGGGNEQPPSSALLYILLNLKGSYFCKWPFVNHLHWSCEFSKYYCFYYLVFSYNSIIFSLIVLLFVICYIPVLNWILILINVMHIF